ARAAKPEGCRSTRTASSARWGRTSVPRRARCRATTHPERPPPAPPLETSIPHATRRATPRIDAPEWRVPRRLSRLPLKDTVPAVRKRPSGYTRPHSARAETALPSPLTRSMSRRERQRRRRRHRGHPVKRTLMMATVVTVCAVALGALAVAGWVAAVADSAP